MDKIIYYLLKEAEFKLKNKMKKTLALLLLGFSLFTVLAQSKEITKLPEHPTSEDSVKFFGKVQFVKETSYDVVEKFGEISKGKINRTKVYKCDSKKLLIEYEEGYYGYSPVNYKTIINYNENGDKTEKRSYSDEKLDSAIMWKYNEKGYAIEKNSYGADKELFRKIRWKRNDKNTYIEESEYDGLGNAIAKEIRDFDAKGHYRGHTKYEDGKLKWKCTHKLDDRGNQIRNVRVGRPSFYYDDDRIDTFWIRKFKYDEFDNIVETSIFQDNRLSYKGFNKYDEKKVRIEERYFHWYYNDYGNLYYSYHDCSSTFRFYNSNEEPTVAYGYNYYGYWCEKYDKKGNLIEFLSKENGCSSPMIGGKYSEEEAKKIERELKNMKDFDSKTEHVYTFDKHGNWITKTTYVQNFNSMPTCTGIIEREIEYYE